MSRAPYIWGMAVANVDGLSLRADRQCCVAQGVLLPAPLPVQVHEEGIEHGSQSPEPRCGPGDLVPDVQEAQKRLTDHAEHAAPRLIESAFTQEVSGEADIFIYPGYEFRIIDALLTNFHAPRSTVLMLTAAFAGKELLRRAYQEALARDYRFLSYGDSMLVE